MQVRRSVGDLKVPSVVGDSISQNSGRAARFGTFHLLLFGAFVLLAAIVFWGANRGFDLTDEGSLMLLYARPHDYMNLSSCQLILSKLPKLSYNEVCNYRLLHLISCVVSALILSAGVCVWAKDKLPNVKHDKLLSLLLFALISNFTAYAILQPSLSYNGVTDFLLYCAAGLIFLANATTKHSNRMLDIALIGLAGFCVGLTFFVKITCGLLFLLLASILVPSRQRLKFLVLIMCGAATGIIVYFTLFDNPLDWLARLTSMLGSEWSDGTHLPNVILREYFLDGMKNLCRMGLVCTPLSISFFLIRRKRHHPLARLAAIVLVLAAGLYLYRSQYFLKTNFLYAAGAICVTTMLVSIKRFGATSMLNDLREYFCGLAFLGILPLLLSAGTDAELLWHAASHITPWLMMSAMCLLPCDRWLPKVFTIYTGFMTVFVSWLVIFHYVLQPNRLPASLMDQNLPAASGTVLSGLLLDKATKDLIDNVASSLNSAGFRRGDPIIALYELPGLVYAVGGRSSGAPWFRVAMQDVACRGLEKLSTDQHDRLFLILTSSKLSARLLKTFEQLQMPFPAAFVPIGTIHDHERGWWDLSQLHLYSLRLQTTLSRSNWRL